jgi:hypothetical protein
MFQNVANFDSPNVLEMLMRTNQIQDIPATMEFRNFDLPELEVSLTGHKSDGFPRNVQYEFVHSTAEYVTTTRLCAI